MIQIINESCGGEGRWIEKKEGKWQERLVGYYTENIIIKSKTTHPPPTNTHGPSEEEEKNYLLGIVSSFIPDPAVKSRLICVSDDINKQVVFLLVEIGWNASEVAAKTRMSVAVIRIII
jgi:hypothetical protein